MFNTSPLNGPCLNCTDRKPACHGSCEKYQSFSANNPSRLITKARRKELATRNYQIDSCYKAKKRCQYPNTRFC